eukprot:TRINITY_DN12127_c0_g3_i3.p1 TRINITY_DN12127_c0_g3~~TRINITY_DN12127_c0_g3_i3.p1  ORF type:complete len:155 (-),score=9.34 TRINITY_DN12127_c0_g3_i3:507-971(-)
MKREKHLMHGSTGQGCVSNMHAQRVYASPVTSSYESVYAITYARVVLSEAFEAPRSIAADKRVSRQLAVTGQRRCCGWITSSARHHGCIRVCLEIALTLLAPDNADVRQVSLHQRQLDGLRKAIQIEIHASVSIGYLQPQSEPYQQTGTLLSLS